MQPEQWSVGQVIDNRYRVLDIHDGGSMGLVYRVRHLEWGADLAVKSPRPELARDIGGLNRFVAEAEAWVDLDIHPNVCACEYVRDLDGIPRVFAEYVAGGSLLDRIRDRSLYKGDRVLDRILDLAIQMAWGLEHAHAKGLVHRDVKPANVLLDADGQAKLTDFGLARSEGSFTHAYASPQQLHDLPTDHSTDIFSYAVMVLELFTGGATWLFGPSAEEILATLQDAGQPEPWLPALPPKLAKLLERCLREKPSERPRSFTEIADELTTVHQAATGTPHRRIKPKAADLRGDEHNNRALSLLDLDRPDDAEREFVAALRAAPAHLAATYNTGLTRWRSGLLTDQGLLSSLEAIPDTPARRLLAQVQMERGDLATARTLLTRAEPGQDVASLLEFLDDQLLIDAEPCTVRTLSKDGFEAAAITADGSRTLTSSKDGTVRLWDARTGKCLQVLRGNGSRLQDLDLSDDGRYAAVSTANAAYLWELATGRCLRVLEAADRGRIFELSDSRDWHGFLSVHLAPDGERALAVDERARVWDLFSGQLQFSLNAFRDSPDVLVSMSSRRLLSWGKDGVVRVWDLDSGQVLHAIPARVLLINHAGMVASDGRTVLLEDQDNRVGLWDVESGKQVRVLPRSVIWSATAKSEASDLVLTGDSTGSVRVWNFQSGQCLRTFVGHKGEVAAVRISADGRTGLSVGTDGALRHWLLPRGDYRAPYQLSRPRLHRELNDLDAQTDLLLEAAREALTDDRRQEALQLLRRARSLPGQEYMPRVRAAWRAAGEVTRWTGPRAPRQELALAASLHRSVTLAADRPIAALGGEHIQLWDLETGSLLCSIGGHPSPIRAVALSRDASQLCSATYDGEISLWSVPSGERLRLVEGRGTAGASAAAFTEDGRLALVGGHDNQVVLWDLTNGERLAVLGRHNSTVPAASPVVPATFSMVTSAWISPGGEIGATTGGDGLVRIWDLRNCEPLQVLRGHTHWTGSACLSGDLRFVLSSGLYGDRTIRLWDLATETCLQVFDEMPEVANKVLFTPNDGFALSTGEDGKILIWDSNTGHCVKVLEGHRHETSDIAISADGWRAASIGGDGILRVWDLDWDLSAH